MTTNNAVRGSARVRPLFARVAPHWDESLLSLVSRSCAANVFERPADLMRFAGIRVARCGSIVFMDSQRTVALPDLLSVPPEDIGLRLHPRVVDGGFPEGVDWYGAVLPRRYVESRTRRVSPLSLRSSPYHRSTWMIRPLSFCAESWERLIRNCPYCERTLGWHQALGPWRCEWCGRSLRHYRGEQVLKDLRSDLQIATDLVSPDATTRRNALSKLPPPFCKWGAGEAFAAIVELGTGAQIHKPDGDPGDAIRLTACSRLETSSPTSKRSS